MRSNQACQDVRGKEEWDSSNDSGQMTEKTKWAVYVPLRHTHSGSPDLQDQPFDDPPRTKPKGRRRIGRGPSEALMTRAEALYDDQGSELRYQYRRTRTMAREMLAERSDEGDRHGRAYVYGFKSYAPPTRETLGRVLGGACSVRMHGVERTRGITIDFDVHRAVADLVLAGKAQAVVSLLSRGFDDLDVFLGRAVALEDPDEVVRAWVLRVLGSRVRWMSELLAGRVAFELHPGMHALIRLTRHLDVREAARMGRRLVELLEMDLGEVESFPKEHRNGNVETCTLPLGRAGARLVDPCTLERLHVGRLCRVRDQRHLLGMGIDPEELDRVLASALPCGLGPVEQAPTATRVAVEEPPRKPQDASGVPKVRGQGAEVKGAPGAPGDPATEDGGQLTQQTFGRQFSRELFLLYRDGIPVGRSWDATRVMAGACVYYGMVREQAEVSFARLLARSNHGARHCQTEAGRRELMQKFRAQWRHQERGVATGTVKPGRMKNQLGRAVLHALMTGQDLVVPTPRKLTKDPAPRKKPLSRAREALYPSEKPAEETAPRRHNETRETERCQTRNGNPSDASVRSVAPAVPFTRAPLVSGPEATSSPCDPSLHDYPAPRQVATGPPRR